LEPLQSDDVPAPGPAAGGIRIDDREFPWWLVWMIGLIIFLIILIVVNDDYQEAFRSIFPWPWEWASASDDFWTVRWPDNWNRGITFTLILTAGSFVFAMFLGLFIGLARLASYRGPNPVVRVTTGFVRNLATFYIELVRGIPMIVFIFFVALVLAPDFANLVNMESRSISQAWRGTAALSLFYAAFIAEVFRAGIQSVPEGQSEAGRAVGLNERQITRRIVLPQAVRNMLPALGNDLIALMKDTSLVSVLAVRELTQMARLYTGSSFRFREGFFILMVVYVMLTLTLSLLLRWYERRITVPGY
jgi:polar amino acid transport system permease protein